MFNTETIIESRRALMIRGAQLGAGVAFAAALAGCQGLTSTQLQNDAELISTGLSGILGDLQAIPGLTIPPDVVTKVQQELSIISAQAQQIGSVVGSNPAQAISAAVGVVAAALAPFFPMAPMVAVAVQAAVVLAQTLISSVPAQQAVAGVRMDATQARLVLQSMSK